jgi:hypothetical protein
MKEAVFTLEGHVLLLLLCLLLPGSFTSAVAT